MRRWILLFVAGLIGLPLLLHAIALDDSFVVFVFGQTTVEMPLWFVVATMFVFSITSYYAARLLYAVLLAPRRVNRWMDRRNQRRVHDLTLRGYLSLLEGNWSNASRDLQKAGDKASNAALNYLLAAQARVENNDLSSAETLLRKAEQLLPDSRIPVGIYQAQLLQKIGVPEKAHDILQTLAGENPRHTYLQKLLVDSYRQRGESDTVLKILTQQNRQKPLQDPDMITELCRLQISHGSSAAAEELLRKQLARQWRSEWVALYGQAQGQDAVKQLQTAEKWLKDHPGDTALMLTLAHICQRNHLWAKARDYYESYLQKQKNEAVARELVQLLQALGEQEKAQQWLQKIAAHHVNALPLPPPLP
ncbi:MAG TPA: heme biosynthesis HemY N-terminal domain-containing protein [Pseudomonadales bacterium]|nr:heme biosynthesis HemY N-terminal domain-containing protein [Pseudomonadales bacterium]